MNYKLPQQLRDGIITHLRTFRFKDISLEEASVFSQIVQSLGGLEAIKEEQEKQEKKK